MIAHSLGIRTPKSVPASPAFGVLSFTAKALSGPFHSQKVPLPLGARVWLLSCPVPTDPNEVPGVRAAPLILPGQLVPTLPTGTICTIPSGRCPPPQAGGVGAISLAPSGIRKAPRRNLPPEAGRRRGMGGAGEVWPGGQRGCCWDQAERPPMQRVGAGSNVRGSVFMKSANILKAPPSSPGSLFTCSLKSQFCG